MSQHPIIDSDTKSSSSYSLKPELSKALTSLEVQLDQELTRYRRTRYEHRSSKTASVETTVVNTTQELENKTETAVKIDSLLPEVNTEQTPIISPPNPKLELIKQEENDHIQGGSAQDNVTTLQPPKETNLSSSIVPTKQTEEKETLVPTNPKPTHPDDYLESSEALLRSLEDQEPQTKKDNNYSETLLSPVGIGSMLLLLLASLTLGYVVLNPQSLPQFDLSKLKFFNFNFVSNNNKSEPGQNNNSSPSQPNITPIPKYPNLAAREFPEVKDPNDVVGLKPKPKPTPIPITQPPAIANTKRPIPSTALPDSTTQPTQTLPGLNTDIKPSADGYYYLIIDNKGDDALAKVKQVVPDAYLSDGKKYIYLAALTDEEEVKQRLQKLRANGIKARVRQP